MSMNTKERGMTVILVIAFMGVLSLILAAMTGYVFQQAKYGRALYAREQALQIAEAGLEYYRWFLAKTPSAMSTGVGLETPYTHYVKDPEGATIGSATIGAIPGMACGVVQYMDLESTGSATANPQFSRTLSARYMRPTVAEYSFIFNSSVWFGSGNTGTGPYHANNGVRMDGTNNSTVSSAVSQFWCDSSFACSPAQWVPGVYGNGSGSNLWEYPVPSVDFPGMAVNFSTLRGYAQTSGILLTPTAVYRAGVQQGSSFSSVGANDQRGFHLVFNADGTVSVYRVTGVVSGIYSYNSRDGWNYTYPVISSEVLHGTYSLPSGCSVIYSDAKTWIEGTVYGKTTVVVADSGSYVSDIVIPNSISYATQDGLSGLTAVAEGDVEIGLSSPDVLTLHGIFVAQSGFYHRNYYLSGYIPSQYNSYIVQSTINAQGAIVSYQRGAINYSSGGTTVSGYPTRVHNADRVIAFSPPPFTPSVSADYSFFLWREE
jgi:hypothetical protein